MTDDDRKGSSRFAKGADKKVDAMIDAQQLTEERYEQGATWSAVDLDPFKRGEQVVDPPKFLVRKDGRSLIYPGRPHVFYGESESLKSWAALEVCREVVAEGLTALYVDFEGSEPSFVERCRLVGVPDGMIGGALRYVRPSVPLTAVGDAGVLARAEWLFEVEATSGVIVLDGVSECYALHGWEINKAEDAARFQRTFAVEGPATVSIDHTAKEAGRGVLGSQHKRAGLDGAEYEFRSRVRGGRGGESKAEVFVTKDRHGWVREWSPSNGFVGNLWVRPDGVALEAGGFKDMLDPRDDRRDAVVEFVRANPGASRRDVADGAGIGNTETGDALKDATAAGLIENRGSTTRHAWYAVAES
ncbi:MAG TPA: hypothetical protein VGL16_14900 [Actinomycetota bacterium]|jgi:hypothetical protein